MDPLLHLLSSLITALQPYAEDPRTQREDMPCHPTKSGGLEQCARCRDARAAYEAILKANQFISRRFRRKYNTKAGTLQLVKRTMAKRLELAKTEAKVETKIKSPPET